VFYPVWAPSPEPVEGEPVEGNEEGTGDRHIVGIKHVESVDLVFEPAADGRILQALSARCINQQSPILNSQSSKGANSTMTDQPVTPVSEVPETRSSSSPDPSINRWANATADIATLALINASGLPQAAREKLVKQFNAHPAADPQEVEDAIETERGYLAQLQQDDVVQIGGQPPRAAKITNMLSSLDRILEATEAMFEGRRPKHGIQPLTGIRELYHLLSGDYEMTGVFQQERIQFANVTSSTMANLVANVLNKRVMAEFQQYPHWWEPIVIQEDFQNLQQVKWITLGGIGELPTVGEGSAYTELTWDDGAETSTFVKKGGYLGLTIEAIDKDDTGRVRAAPRALAQAAWLTLAKAISAIFTSNSGVGPTMSDSVALFDAGHSNLGSTALSILTWNAARLAMRKQTELNSSERLGALTAPKFLLVPPDLEVTALQVLASEYDYLYALSNGVQAPPNVNAEGDSFNARMAMAKNRVIVVDLWTDANDWAAVADPRLYPTIGVGFRYGRAPEVFSVASPTAGLMFTNDTMPVKVRFFFAVGPIDYRGLYKANVA